MKKVPPLLNAAQIERYLDFGEFLGKCVKLLKTNVRDLCRKCHISVQYTYRNRILKRVLVELEHYVNLMEVIRGLLEATPTQDNMILHAQLKVAWITVAGF